MMSPHLKYSFLVIVFATLLSVGITKAAWRDAPAGPPNYGAVSPDTQADYKPVNLGSSPQAKLGGFTIGTSTPLSADMLQIESPTANAGIVFSRGGTVVGGILANTVNQLNIQALNQPIRFSTNGFTTEHMRIATSGNVGIGTEAPSARLAIGDTGSPGDTIAAYANSSQSTLYAEQSGSGYAIYASGGLNYFSGNVGIGTTSPTGKLNVMDTNGGFFFAGSDASYNRFKSVTTNLGVGKDLLLATNDAGDSGLYIKSVGNVGIGTSDPGAKLHVQGASSGLLFDGSTSVPEIKSAGSNVDLRLSAVGTGGWVALRANGVDRLVADASGIVTVGGTLNAGTLQQGGTAVCLSTGVNCQVAGAPAWASITGKPTTIAGYSITDMSSQSVSYADSAGSANSVAWSSITSRPSGLDDGDDVGTNYVSGLIAGTGVTVSGTASNGWTPRIDVAVSEADTLQTVTNRGSGTTNSITAAGFYISSDARLKKNVETLSGSLEKLGRVRGVYYDLASGQGARQIGVIAQELEQEFPELIKTDDNGYKAVAYDRLSAVLIEAIKELKAQNQALQSRLDHIEKKW